MNNILKQIKIKRHFVRFGALCLVLCVMLLTVMAFSVPNQTVASANNGSLVENRPHLYLYGIPVYPETLLRTFFMEMPLTQINDAGMIIDARDSVFSSQNINRIGSELLYPNMINSANISRSRYTFYREVSFVVTFHSLLIRERPFALLMTTSVRIIKLFTSVTSSLSIEQINIEFLADREIGLTQNHYTYITQISTQDFTGVSLDLSTGRVGAGWHPIIFLRWVHLFWNPNLPRVWTQRCGHLRDFSDISLRNRYVPADGFWRKYEHGKHRQRWLSRQCFNCNIF